MVRNYVGTDRNDFFKANPTNESWHMAGGFGDDTLIGGDKNDTLHGGGFSHDSLVGGKGSDTYYIDSYDDVIVEKPYEGYDTVYSRVSHTLDSNFEQLLLIPDNRAIYATGNSSNNYLGGNNRNNKMYGLAGQDNLKGEDGNDYLEGGDGFDTLYGGNGNDTLVGNRKGDGTSFEFDRLYGGAGSDTFVLGDKNVVISYNDRDGADRAEIYDFQPGVDKLQLGGDRKYHVVNNNNLYFDHDRNGALNSGDDLIAIVHGVTESQLISAVNSAVYKG